MAVDRSGSAGRWSDPDRLRSRSIDGRQFARIDEYTLAPGGRRVRITAADGFDVELLPDRALDLGSVSYQGIPLGFVTPAVLAAGAGDGPAGFALRFGAGLLTTCGLDHFGPAIRDDGVDLPQHGRATDLPALRVNAESGWQEGSFVLSVSARMRQWRFFGEDLLWDRTVSTALGSDTLTISDLITNAGPEAWPHMMLYHCNIGHPVLDEGTTVSLRPGSGDPGSAPEPRDAAAAAGLESWNRFGPPQRGFAEQVFRHTLDQDAEMAEIAVSNPTLGVEVTVAVDPRQLPWAFQWTMAGQGTYVLGIEPANCPVISGRTDARNRGVLPTLEPGETRRYDLRIRVERC
jgi:hypothetical protein